MMREWSLLLVEDGPENVQILREAMRTCAVPCEIIVVEDGAVALRRLEQYRMGEMPRLPDLILLDLSLPNISGQEILRTLKGDPKLKTIPVIVLSDCTNQDEIDGSYRLHANAYVVKPERWDDFVRLTASIGAFWLSVASLPRVTGCINTKQDAEVD
jgi:CheY-like chemotaxis protein